jgi:hypothetical protein
VRRFRLHLTANGACTPKINVTGEAVVGAAGHFGIR